MEDQEITENVHFLSECERIRGHQNLNISYKQQNYWMLKYEGNIEKQLIMFDEDQRSIVELRSRSRSGEGQVRVR